MTLDTRHESRSTGIFDHLLQAAELERLAGELKAGTPIVVVSGLTGSARALVLAALEKKTDRRIVFVARSNREVEEFQSDVEFFFAALNGARSGESPILTIPALETDPYDGTSPHAEVLEQRALALYRASRKDARILLTSVAALAERTITPESLNSSSIVLRAGDEMPPELIVDLLIASGYVRAEPVGSVGEFSLRGGILDIFSPAHDAPHRIEFFGDTVESIREFDPDTQRSVGNVQESTIVPMRELAVRREEFIRWADAAQVRWDDELYRHDLRSRLAHAERGEPFPGWEYLLPLTHPLTASAFDYLRDSIFVIDEPVEIEKKTSELYAYLQDRFSSANEAGELALPPEMLFLTKEELREGFTSSPRVELRLLGREASAIDEYFRIEGSITSLDIETEAVESGAPLVRPRPSDLFLFSITQSTPEIALSSRPPRRYYGRLNEMAQDLTADGQSETVLFVMPSLGLAERVVEMLSEYNVTAQLSASIDPSDVGSSPPERVSLLVTVGRLSNGFQLPAGNLRVVVESDIFGDTERFAPPATPKKTRKRRAAAFLSDLGDLKAGDYVVHVDHGIGQFGGLIQMTTAGGPTGNVAAGLERAAAGIREFMLLTYADNANLYVPVERLDLVQRYSAAEGARPQLDRLGGVGWQKAKARAKRAMRDMAEELLKLYAERKLASGHSYGPDTAWQKEFEDSFEYQLTPDQETAIGDVKSGMESPQPMDRLIVGDVGYGKTEVAMRAAFKALMESKQTAILAPTTVLVFQHYKTLQKRFSAFPARIEMLSRFRTAKEQRAIVNALQTGAIDIVVGTHRLLSKDIRFRDLGLLVVDEEQRFGVAHKERIKQMRKKVDVISMSATPIPRTLNMSLAGLRDMSVIETPPRDRLAIQTHVVKFSDIVIRSAIELELQRSGQVFFVHNRVETIYSIAELIGRLVPEARIGVGHGQMTEKQLEDVILKFIGHELDVLVSTTIIENGIDIPLANTIIINRADMYGLSQLYQLRGRVGRSNRHAYSYLLIPTEETLTAIARRRLAAIREFSDLGAGFRIAALDLELRGAGNLLGGQQSGHIDAIGFDLYTQMLERTVRELKGEPVEDEVSTVLNLGIDIRIPDHYINDISQRLRTYKRISSAESDDELADIHSEISDRYGPIPQTIENLFEYSRLRRETSRIGIVSIDREGERLAIKFGERANIDPEKLIAMVSKSDLSFSPAGVLKAKLTSEDDADVFAEIRGILAALRQ